MDPLGVLGIAALGAVSTCLATDCADSKPPPPPPPAVVVQQANNLKSSEPLSYTPPQITYAPKQTINVAPTMPMPQGNACKVVVTLPPPKVDDLMTCPVENASAIKASQVVNIESAKREELRPELLTMQAWMLSLPPKRNGMDNDKPSSSFSALALSVSFALSVSIPLAAGWMQYVFGWLARRRWGRSA